MSKEQRIVLWPLLIVVVAISGALVFGAVRSRNHAKRKTASISTAHRVNAVEAPARPQVEYVSRGRLWPQLRAALTALGSRLEKPGKERLALAGTLNRDSEQPATFAAILEFPGRVRITTQSGVQSRTIVFDSQSERTVGGSLTSAEQDLIESLMYDSAEHFFSGQMNGASTRHLGNYFRTDDGSTANYEGPFYDVFSMMDLIKGTAGTRSQTKVYCFNSETHLLEKVQYQIFRNGKPVEVETHISGWRTIGDQQVPSRVIRIENNRQVFDLTIGSATLGPRINDDLF